jgi:hypothetical protein
MRGAGELPTDKLKEDIETVLMVDSKKARIYEVFKD